MWIIKFLVFLWPFVKEMVLGEKTLKQAMSDNKRRVLLMIVILASIGLNLFSISRLVTLSSKYLKLQDDYLTLQRAKPVPTTPSVKHTEPVMPVTSVPIPTISKEEVSVVAAKPPTKSPRPRKREKAQPLLPVNDERYSRIRDDFLKMKQREEGAP